MVGGFAAQTSDDLETLDLRESGKWLNDKLPGTQTHSQNVKLILIWKSNLKSVKSKIVWDVLILRATLKVMFFLLLPLVYKRNWCLKDQHNWYFAGISNTF